LGHLVYENYLSQERLIVIQQSRHLQKQGESLVVQDEKKN
jgi:hypothetical protein